MSKLDLIAPDSPEAALSRRSLVQTIAGTALAMTFLAGCGGSDDDDDNNNGGNNGSSSLDADILNFALNLEYLEAEFYSFATTGAYLPATLTSAGSPSLGANGKNTSGATTGGGRVNFTSTLGREIANEITLDERTHVSFLRNALSGAFIAKPAINLNPFNLNMTSETVFLQYARAFEDVGVSAYLGAAPAISSKTYLAAAGAILAVEALHTGNLRLQCVLNNSSGTPSGAPLDGKDQLPNAADPNTSQAHNYAITNTSALAIPRNPFEVAKIVLNQPNASTATLVNAGAFFPAGVNGNLARLFALA